MPGFHRWKCPVIQHLQPSAWISLRDHGCLLWWSCRNVSRRIPSWPLLPGQSLGKMPWHGSVWGLCPGVESLAACNLGGPLGVVFNVVPPKGMPLHGIWGGCCLLGLGDCLGTGVEGMAKVGLFFPLGKPSVIGWMGVMEVSAPVKCVRKQPEHPSAVAGWCIGQPGRWRGSQLGFCSPLRWLASPGPAWCCHVPSGVTQPGRLSGPWHL